LLRIDIVILILSRRIGGMVEDSVQKFPSVAVQNFVASASVKQAIDLHSIVRIFSDVEYRPEGFRTINQKAFNVD